MKKLVFVLFFFALVFVFLHALDYIESSTGLQDPQLESGRTELELADINADGNLDILSIGDHGSPYINTQEHGIMVWFGDGSGNWSVYQNGNFGYGGMAIGDLNNDGHLDVGYGMHHNYSGSDFGDSILEAALGDGTGQNWQAWDDGISISNPNQWGMFCTDFADIDNDGLLDLGANSFGSGDGIHIFLNNGDGTWLPCFGFLGGNSTMDFCFGDVNADGNADFAVAHEYGSVYLGDGAGNFVLCDGNLPSPGWVGRYGPDLGDIDNDGDEDFAFCNSNGGVEVWTWEGNSTWANASGTLPVSGQYEVTQLCDVNIDGFIDVVAFGDGTASVWLGDGAGNWILDATFTTPAPGQFSAFRVGGDADHNGYPDIALVAREGDTWSAINHLRFFRESSAPESLFIFPVFPRGGEDLRAGSVRRIEWTCGVPSGTAIIALDLSTSGVFGPWLEIADSVVDNGHFQWSIPQGINSNDCYVRYTAVAGSDTVSSTTESAFSISTGSNIDEGIPHIIKEGNRLSVQPSVGRSVFMVHVTTAGGDLKRISIYDVLGNVVRELMTVCGGGYFVVPWDRKDTDGQIVPCGTYYATVTGEDDRCNAKVIVVE